MLDELLDWNKRFLFLRIVLGEDIVHIVADSDELLFQVANGYYEGCHT